ncbi:hypothetical protein BJX61DRAFT_542987 [Aspergillus egyptiacus]|nr:hypothetical protein BJX61DRAFT_542987 [Aspergillus egyptiacus]
MAASPEPTVPKKSRLPSVVWNHRKDKYFLLAIFEQCNIKSPDYYQLSEILGNSVYSPSALRSRFRDLKQLAKEVLEDRQERSPQISQQDNASDDKHDNILVMDETPDEIAALAFDSPSPLPLPPRQPSAQQTPVKSNTSTRCRPNHLTPTHHKKSSPGAMKTVTQSHGQLTPPNSNPVTRVRTHGRNKSTKQKPIPPELFYNKGSKHSRKRKKNRQHQQHSQDACSHSKSEEWPNGHPPTGSAQRSSFKAGYGRRSDFVFPAAYEG